MKPLKIFFLVTFICLSGSFCSAQKNEALSYSLKSTGFVIKNKYGVDMHLQSNGKPDEYIVKTKDTSIVNALFEVNGCKMFGAFNEIVSGKAGITIRNSFVVDSVSDVTIPSLAYLNYFPFESGTMTGTAIRVLKSDSVVSNYKNSIKDGVFLKYNNGNLVSSGYYKDGIESGRWLNYIKGKLVNIYNYDVRTDSFFLLNGNVYKIEKPFNEVVYLDYNSKDKLIRKHSDLFEESFTNEGVRLDSGYFDLYNSVYVYKTYYPNGKTKELRYYTRSLKDEPMNKWLTYDKKGKVIKFWTAPPLMTEMEDIEMTESTSFEPLTRYQEKVSNEELPLKKIEYFDASISGNDLFFANVKSISKKYKKQINAGKVKIAFSFDSSGNIKINNFENSNLVVPDDLKEKISKILLNDIKIMPGYILIDTNEQMKHIDDSFVLEIVFGKN
ncbi:MAG: hypothetical protein H7321_02845 [Bacteroidia bacterium]|nr:hypothetical protein [Bacteroidia bacterium]